MGKPREGYLLIDHRNSPGVSPELVRAGGVHIPTVGAGQMFESAVLACAHCQSILILNPNRTRPRGYCRKCDAYVCDNPQCNAECTPQAKTFDRMQEQAFRDGAGYKQLTT
jgi:hypothetical protein